jgi:C4-dicarboxylate-specific signal transduction histidine kinase
VRVKANGGELKLMLVSLRFPEDVAAFDRVVVGMMDITKHELAQRALIEAQSVLAKASRTATVGVLSASLAHDLNQPLSAMLMNGQTCLRWLKRQPPDLARLEKSVERIVRDSQRARDIIQNTRQSLMEAVKPAEQIDLEDLLCETRALMEHELRNAAVELDIDVVPEAREIHGARVEIQQVLINLLTNAVQAMQQAASSTKRIEVRACLSNDGQCTIAVRDHGPGIPPANLARLFDPFFTTKASGMGLGLSICRNMIEARGGRLVARNSADGGAIMEITLPLEEENT